MSKLQEVRRAKFEKEFPLSEEVRWDSERNCYCGGKIWWLFEARWEAWNAALDSVVVELRMPPDEWPATAFAVQSSDKYAIEAAGICVEVKS